MSLEQSGLMALLKIPTLAAWWCWGLNSQPSDQQSNVLTTVANLALLMYCVWKAQTLFSFHVLLSFWSNSFHNRLLIMENTTVHHGSVRNHKSSQISSETVHRPNTSFILLCFCRRSTSINKYISTVCYCFSIRELILQPWTFNALLSPNLVSCVLYQSCMILPLWVFFKIQMRGLWSGYQCQQRIICSLYASKWNS